MEGQKNKRQKEGEAKEERETRQRGGGPSKFLGGEGEKGDKGDVILCGESRILLLVPRVGRMIESSGTECSDALWFAEEP